MIEFEVTHLRANVGTVSGTGTNPWTATTPTGEDGLASSQVGFETVDEAMWWLVKKAMGHD